MHTYEVGQERCLPVHKLLRVKRLGIWQRVSEDRVRIVWEKT